MKEKTIRWLLQGTRPSLLVLVILNSILWSMIFFFAPNIGNRTTMRMFMNLAAPEVWGSIWAFAAVYQVFAQFQQRNWCKQWAAAGVALLNWYSTIILLLVLWPSVPSMIGGQICVTLAATLLYITGERRRGLSIKINNDRRRCTNAK